MDHFTVHTEYGNGMVVVHPNGDLDLANHDVLQESLAAVERDVVIDLTGVTFIDSSGIAVLVSEQQRLTGAGWDVRLVNPREPVHRVLTLVGLGRWLDD